MPRQYVTEGLRKFLTNNRPDQPHAQPPAEKYIRRIKETMMKVLSFLFWAFLLLIAAAIVLPILSVGFVLLCSLGVFLVWLLPILIIAASDKTGRGEKFCWILAIVFLSWFAWIFYFFLAPLKPVERDYYYY